MDVFPMDIDAPGLIQDLDEFTQQILGPGIELSSHLEAAISSDTNASAVDDSAPQINSIEGTRIEFTPHQINSVIDKLQLQIQPTKTSSEMAVCVAAENNLPLSEPVFQILSEMFQEYSTANNSAPQTLKFSHIPKHDDTSSEFFESYPYESWDSPGSVEDDALFPDLSF
jgi:hypothetical protein